MIKKDGKPMDVQELSLSNSKQLETQALAEGS